MGCGLPNSSVPDWNWITTKSLSLYIWKIFLGCGGVGVGWGWGREKLSVILGSTHHTFRFPGHCTDTEYFILVPRRYRCPTNVRIFVKKSTTYLYLSCTVCIHFSHAYSPSQTETQKIASEHKKFFFLLWGWLNSARGCSGQLWSLHAWRWSVLNWIRPWATCWPLTSRNAF